MQEKYDGLAEMLRQERQAAGHSVSAAAALAGISRRSLTRWENGAARPRLYEIQRLLSVLKVSESQRRSALKLLGTPAGIKQLRKEDAQPFPFAAPHGGEILRALRLRRGWKQDQAAARLGVTQATVARWESGKVWPSPETLQRTCCTLGALEEELAALLQGGLSLSPDVNDAAESYRSLETMEDQFLAVERMVKTPRNVSLKELHYLLLEARLGSLAQQDEAARFLLARIYTQHARHLYLLGRFYDSEVAAQNALSFNEREDAEGIDLRACSTIQLAEATVYQRARPDSRVGMKLLDPWLSAPLTISSMGSVQSVYAWYLMHFGRHDESLAMARSAYSLRQKIADCRALYGGRYDLGCLYMKTGKPGVALEILSTLTENASPGRSFVTLAMTETYLALGKHAEAQSQLVIAQADIEAFNMHLLRPGASAMASQL